MLRFFAGESLNCVFRERAKPVGQPTFRHHDIPDPKIGPQRLRRASMILRRRVILGGLLLAGLSGCGEPGEVIEIAPPGAAPQPTPAENDPAQAQGEMPSVQVAKSKTVKPGDYKPALPTAKGETKRTKGGVKYETVKEGTGAEYKLGQRALMHYVGTLENGEVIDSTRTTNQPRTLQIGIDPLIRGWEEAIPGMKVGETRNMLIPAELAYGERGKLPTVPPGANLKFEIELLNIVPDQ
jgi:FKBP-type peptidyl-prolyl cis-trans isomerase